MIAQVMMKVNAVFDQKNLEALARETGFLKRKRKIDPKEFLEKIIFLRLESPNSTLGDLVLEFFKSDTRISKQGLHKKFAQSAVDFFHSVLDKLLQHAFSEQQIYLGALPFVKNVQVIDSSEIRLNKALKDIFPQVRNQGAAVKLQALMNVVNNQILSLDVRPSNEPDQGYKEYLAYVEEGDLLIGDLGYFSIDSFSEIQRKEGYFLSRYFKRTNVYNLMTGEEIDLRKELSQAQEDRIELDIGLSESKFRCRLVAILLTDEAYEKRLKNLKEKQRKDPRSKTKKDDILNRWTIFVTNLPSTVEANILLQVYAIRWQIELLFKMMKTFLNLRKIDSGNQHRVSISLYVSLITMTLLSYIASTIVDKEISLYKASKVFIKHIREFFSFINSKICAVTWIKARLSRFALKESRKKRPSTKQSLGLSYA